MLSLFLNGFARAWLNKYWRYRFWDAKNLKSYFSRWARFECFQKVIYLNAYRCHCKIDCPKFWILNELHRSLTCAKCQNGVSSALLPILIGSPCRGYIGRGVQNFSTIFLQIQLISTETLVIDWWSKAKLKF